MNVAYHLIASN